MGSNFKKSYILLMLLTVIIGSRTFAQDSGIVAPGASNIIYQSNNGGQTWQDISQGLPEKEQPEDFFAGESSVYLRVKNVMYRSKSNLKTPVWEKETVLDPQSNGLQPSMNISSIKQIGNYLICGHPDGIFRSSDMGKTWNMVHPSVNNVLNIYDKPGNVVHSSADSVFTLNAKISNTVPVDDNRRVFKIYVSGKVLYAVARNSGC